MTRYIFLGLSPKFTYGIKITSYFISIVFILLLLPLFAFAQSGLESQIRVTINDLVRLINILIVGFVVWAGFLIAKGDGVGQQKLIYGIIGLIVVNTANLIITYFR